LLSTNEVGGEMVLVSVVFKATDKVGGNSLR